MKVKIEFNDYESLTVEEIVRQAQHAHGKHVKVEVMPESTLPYDLIYAGLQKLITHQQLGLLYNSGESYQQDLTKLRSDVLYSVQEIIDQVIIDTESKVS